MDSAEPSVSFKPGSSDEKIEIKTTDPANLEKSEMNDTVKPMKKVDYDNKAFELEDVVIDANTEKNPFDRTQRPGSMMSIRSNASTSSRSSINCTTGRVRCPNLRLQKFFSYRPDTGFQKASDEIKKLILPEKDGEFIGNWLLIEISTWDLHREKIVMLTERTVIVIAYDFIKSRITNYHRISLNDLKTVKFGNLVYPKSSVMGEYVYGAVKLCWGDDNLSVVQKWNPFNFNIPFIIFTSHHILYNDKEKETAFYNCDEFIASLEFALSKLSGGDKVEMKEEPIEITSYASLVSVLYNHNWLGFQLDRNGVNY